MAAGGDNKLSTTALAKKLNIPTQQLFVTLKDYDWIVRINDAWKLTQKGEFEGGTYQKSRRYGSYIVWPEHIDQHPLLAAIESNQRITAASMCRYYPHTYPRQINRALAELGLQFHSVLGWELTPRGRRLGGQQEESKNSGAYYVTWPHEIIDEPVIHRELSLHSPSVAQPDSEGSGELDLFASGQVSEGATQGLDGHVLSSSLQVAVCNWLYLAQLVHAHGRALPVEELVYADFYVPAGNIYIDCWEADAPAKELSIKLHKREIYRAQELRHLEVNTGEEARLDEVLGGGLLGFGIRV